jgi:hypothetical protein
MSQFHHQIYKLRRDSVRKSEYDVLKKGYSLVNPQLTSQALHPQAQLSFH